MSFKDLKRIGTCPLRKDYVMPVRVIWASEGATNTECLLINEQDQAYQGADSFVTMSTKDGKKAAFVLDFGTELAGGVRFVTNTGDWGRNVDFRISFGESVSEAMTPLGEKHSDNSHTPRDYTAVTNSVLSTVEIGTSAFRFVYVEMMTPDAEREIVSLHAMFTYRDVPYVGSFSCNDEEVNKIYEAAAHTAHLCMQNYVWDGAKRDRLIWSGDLSHGMKAIRSIFGRNEAVDATLRFQAREGKLPYYWNFMSGDGCCYVMTLDEWYLYTGDADLVKELSPYWTALLKQLANMVGDEAPYLTKESFVEPDNFFWDWTTSEQGSDEATLAGLYTCFYRALTAGKRLCDVAGLSELSALCERKAGYLSENPHQHFGVKTLVTEMYLCGHMGKEEAAKALTVGGAKSMGASNGYMILRAMAETAGMEFALSVLREYYGSMLKMGATTFWEYYKIEWYKEGATIERKLEEGEYDIHGDNGEFCYTGHRNSLCHVWGSNPAAFLAEAVLGVQIVEPGCKKIAVKPNLGDLTWVKGAYATPYGPVTIEHRKENGKIKSKIKAPRGVKIVK
ncbi:MAG: hypothetical protein E7402_04805 [Ruminococcaceae bacterium]|nr:hypothetical protein [Oscillospiraceae bacterium]